MRRILSASLLFVVGIFLTVWFFFGGTERLENRTGPPLVSGEALEVAATLSHPPGVIAVSASGRVFFNFHPAGHPPVQVAELVDGEPVPWPNAGFQEERADAPYFQSVVSVRIDGRNRLWVLDRAHMGRGQPRLLAFDIDSGSLVHRYDFPDEVAGFPSALNDFAVTPDGQHVYVAHSVPILGDAAIVIYDVGNGTARRVLEGHRSVEAEPYIIRVDGRDLAFLKLVPFTFGVHAIAIDDAAEWLYYGPLSGDRLYRIGLADLNDATLAGPALAAKVEDYGLKTLNGALTIRSGNVFLSDVESSAIVQLEPDRGLRTLVKDPRLRWPESMSFGPDRSLWISCSAFGEVVGLWDSAGSAAPFTIFRLPHDAAKTSFREPAAAPPPPSEE